jgi:ribosomal protein S19
MSHKNAIVIYRKQDIKIFFIKRVKYFKRVGFLTYALFRNFFFKGSFRPKVITIFKRSTLILRKFKELKFRVHNGHVFRLFVIRKKLSGFKFGELLFTRRFGRGDLMHLRRKGKSKKK